jgi:uncharacterized surface protein with fasciclin (FAS1) repeats
VDVATSNRSFKTLATAIKAAGLVDVLSSQGPYTVFAPTDAAFAALPKGKLDMLLKPENKDKLRKVLAYHVLSGALTAKAIQTGDVPTVEGDPLSLKLSGSRVMVNNATVTAADIPASNGVIHAIDKVMLPPGI